VCPSIYERRKKHSLPLGILCFFLLLISKHTLYYIEGHLFQTAPGYRHPKPPDAPRSTEPTNPIRPSPQPTQSQILSSSAWPTLANSVSCCLSKPFLLPVYTHCYLCKSPFRLYSHYSSFAAVHFPSHSPSSWMQLLGADCESSTSNTYIISACRVEQAGYRADIFTIRRIVSIIRDIPPTRCKST
jgi:hypothetical protein